MYEEQIAPLATLATLAQISTPSAAHFLKSHQLLVQKFAADRNWQNPHSRSSLKAMARDGGLSRLGVGSRSPAAWSAREIELQALATLAALAQISTPSAAHFLKSHRFLVQKFAADRDRLKGRLRRVVIPHFSLHPIYPPGGGPIQVVGRGPKPEGQLCITSGTAHARGASCTRWLRLQRDATGGQRPIRQDGVCAARAAQLSDYSRIADARGCEGAIVT